MPGRANASEGDDSGVAADTPRNLCADVAPARVVPSARQHARLLRHADRPSVEISKRLDPIDRQLATTVFAHCPDIRVQCAGAASQGAWMDLDRNVPYTKTSDGYAAGRWRV